MNLADLGFRAAPNDINDERQVVGGQLRMDLDTFNVEDLGIPEGSYAGSYAYSISNNGQITGVAYLATSSDANQAAARFTDGPGWQVVSGPGKYNAGAGINSAGDMSAYLFLTCLGTGYAAYTTGIYRVYDRDIS